MLLFIQNLIYAAITEKKLDFFQRTKETNQKLRLNTIIEESNDLQDSKISHSNDTYLNKQLPNPKKTKAQELQESVKNFHEALAERKKNKKIKRKQKLIDEKNLNLKRNLEKIDNTKKPQSNQYIKAVLDLNKKPNLSDEYQRSYLNFLQKNNFLPWHKKVKEAHRLNQLNQLNKYQSLPWYNKLWKSLWYEKQIINQDKKNEEIYFANKLSREKIYNNLGAATFFAYITGNYLKDRLFASK